MKEKGKHLNAFEIYYSLGNKRTIKKVAEKVGVTEETIRTWKRNFEWEYKINQRDRSLAEKMRKDNIEQFDKATRVYQNGIRRTIKEQFLEPLQRGEVPIKIEKPKDLVDLIKADVLLSGGVTERTEVIEDKQQLKDNEQRIVDMIQSDDEIWEAMNRKFLKQDDTEEGEENGIQHNE